MLLRCSSTRFFTPKVLWIFHINGHETFFNMLYLLILRKVLLGKAVRANLEPVQIYLFLFKIYRFLSKLSRNLSIFKHFFWEFWKSIPPQNSIVFFRKWICKNFFNTFIISWLFPKNPNLLFQIWTETCKFGQESVYALLLVLVYESGQKPS